MVTKILNRDGFLNPSEGVHATKEDYEAADRCVGSIFEALEPGEIVSLVDGLFKLDSDLDLTPLEYEGILETALIDGQQRHPNAPAQYHAAFANSVAYLVTGASGGYGGPSCREHAVSHSALLQGGGKATTVGDMNAFVPGPDTVMPGKWSYESAIAFAEPLCFGKLQDIHFQCYRSENCFDDAPSDVEALKKWQHRSENR